MLVPQLMANNERASVVSDQNRKKQRSADACYKLAREEANVIKKMEICFFGSLASSSAVYILRRIAEIEGCFPRDDESAKWLKSEILVDRSRPLDPWLAREREQLVEELIREIRGAIRTRDPRFFEECAKSLSAIGLSSKPKAANGWAVLQAILVVARQKGPGESISSTEVFHILFPEARIPVASLRKARGCCDSDEGCANPYGPWPVSFWTADSVRSEASRLGLERFPIPTDRVLSDFQAYLSERQAGR